jgi:hypothetical protein
MSGGVENPIPSLSSANHKSKSKSGSMAEGNFCKKIVKRKAEEINLLLGDGVKLHEITHLGDWYFVSHFSNKRMT